MSVSKSGRMNRSRPAQNFLWIGDPGFVIRAQALGVTVERHELTQQLGIRDAIETRFFERGARVGGEALRGDGDPTMLGQFLLGNVLLS
jgi:hypothetical protein